MIKPDPEQTAVGAMERVFLAETTSPGLPSYNADESLRAMRFMRQVIENRLNSHNPIYGAPVWAKTEIDVIRVGTQFRGFGRYPTITRPIGGLIADCLKIANAEHDPRSPSYAKFINNAILAATEAKPPPEASIPINLVGWKTGKSGSPGPNYIFAGTVQGNDFYTVLKIEAASPRSSRGRHQ